jgi:DNA primase
MTTVQIAAVFQAHLVKPEQWKARCPGHDDRVPSLTITQGDDGRTLIHCFGGCQTAQVLGAVGLHLRDLFGRATAVARGRVAASVRARGERESAMHHLRKLHAEGSERLQGMQTAAESLAQRLMRMPDGPEGDALALVFHELLGRIHYQEAALMTIERGLR